MDNNRITFQLIANAALGLGLSGSDRIFIECARRWAAQGHEVCVYVWEEGYEMCKRNKLDNVEYVVLSAARYKKLGFAVLYAVRTLKGLIGALFQIHIPKTQRVVVYSASEFLMDSIPAWVIKARNRQIKWIAGFFLFAPNPFNKHAYRGKRFLWGLFYYISQWLIYWQVKKYADMVFVTNELDRWKFIDDEKLTPERVIAVRGGVDTKTPLIIPEPKEKKFDAIFIGRFHPQKGVSELIDIWKYVCEKRPKAKLAMIGNGDLETEVRDKIEKYGLANNILLFGFKDGFEKIKIFKESAMVLYPAVLDHWSMAPVEAMACGLPLITFDLATLRVLNPKGVVKVPCYDLNAFARAIVDLLEDEKSCEPLQREALEFARTWDWDKRADELLSAIKFLYYFDVK